MSLEAFWPLGSGERGSNCDGGMNAFIIPDMAIFEQGLNHYGMGWIMKEGGDTKNNENGEFMRKMPCGHQKLSLAMSGYGDHYNTMQCVIYSVLVTANWWIMKWWIQHIAQTYDTYHLSNLDTLWTMTAYKKYISYLEKSHVRNDLETVFIS